MASLPDYMDEQVSVCVCFKMEALEMSARMWFLPHHYLNTMAL